MFLAWAMMSAFIIPACGQVEERLGGIAQEGGLGMFPGPLFLARPPLRYTGRFLFTSFYLSLILCKLKGYRMRPSP